MNGRNKISNSLYLGLFLILFSSVAQSAIQHYFTFINNDGVDTGQCSVNTVSGIDYRIKIDVDDTFLSVTTVSLERCSGVAFLAPEILPTSNWVLGMGTGQNGSNIIEGIIPNQAIGNPTQVSLIFASDDGSGGFSDIVSSNNNNASPSWFTQIKQLIKNTSPIPALSGVGLVFLIILIATIPFILKNKGYLSSNIFSMILLVPLLGITIIALGATIIIDGNSSDWSSSFLLASDASGDQTGVNDTDILNTYAFKDGQSLYVRLDIRDTCNFRDPDSKICLG